MSLKKAIPQTGQRKFFEFGKYKIHNSLYPIKKTKFPNTYLVEKIVKQKCACDWLGFQNQKIVGFKKTKFYKEHVGA